ncbi:hypothetical protein TNCV_2137801 [Trichonephila clavipes]|nr:hypothetical protein TNCV_2137801 [Trichonephila clavipes]
MLRPCIMKRQYRQWVVAHVARSMEEGGISRMKVEGVRAPSIPKNENNIVRAGVSNTRAECGPPVTSCLTCGGGNQWCRHLSSLRGISPC